MATRMQQRRGTATQWTTANPILAAGEIGFETDTSKFKIGDGVNHWADLIYYASAADIAALVDGAPDLLNTLNELAAAIGDDANFATTLQNAMDTAEDNSNTYTTNAIDTHNTDTTAVHGIADTTLLATKAYADNAVSVHSADTTAVHGIADTSLLATKSYADSAASGAISASETYADSAISTAVSNHSQDNTNVHGIADTTLLATKSYADSAATTASGTAAAGALQDAKDYADTAVSTHALDTTSVHGIADTSKLVLDTDLSAHATDTTNIHGITDTAALATKTYVDNAGTALQTNINAKAPIASPTFTGTVAGITKSMVGLANVDNTSDANKPVSSATQTALDLKANLAGPTFTGTVVLPSTTSIGNVSATEIGYVDGVTSAIQTQLNAKAPLADPTFTGTVTMANLNVTGTTTTVNSTNLEITDPLIYIATGNAANANDIGLVGHATVSGTYQHMGLVRDHADGKWKLFSGVTTEPANGTVDLTSATYDTFKAGAIEATSATIGNVSNTELQYLDGVTSAVQTQIDAKAPKASPSFTGGVTVDSSGVIFTDGTQTKAGVPSITAFATAISSSATLATGQADKFVPLTGAVTITLPATGYSTGQSIDFYQESGTGAAFASTNSVVGTPGLKLRTTNSVATAMKTASGWLVFGDLSA